MADSRLGEWVGKLVRIDVIHPVRPVQSSDEEPQMAFLCTLEDADEKGLAFSYQTQDDPTTRYSFAPWHIVRYVHLIPETQDQQGGQNAGGQDYKRTPVHLVGLQPIEGDYLTWQLTVPPEHDDQGVTVFFNLRATDSPASSLHYVAQYNEIAWLSPTPDFSEWILDLDELRRSYPDHFPMSWFAGKVRIAPTYRATAMGSATRTGIEFSFESSTPRA